MGQETERRFLVNKALWEQLEKPEGTLYLQGYLLNENDRNVRVRIAGDKGFITVKGTGEGITSLEYEYEIPKADAEEMLVKFRPAGTEKIRYRLPASGGLTWEVDVFQKANEGLIIAEIELEQENQSFEKPAWLGQEITGEERYANASLALHAYKAW
ncbi:CYTH domain-containing protein [Mucilaginibacter conchicola]|uniref:CYTH domain-containing protein n=1 Tax=Mucilaginibacter conchicola TaxID=2303333 RepID=A0A372NQQ2_9SPHI|nr:CYTH domain-containing protein [Mucilaginibacter conchicola]RFZ91271.1 CYTH domain-containing protein [Mucilaginibacter conchicola]